MSFKFNFVYKVNRNVVTRSQYFVALRRNFGKVARTISGNVMTFNFATRDGTVKSVP